MTQKFQANQFIHIDPLERFLAHIEVAGNGCWLWTSSKGGGGYGLFKIDGRYEVAHRWLYEHYNGPVPTPLQLDHLCRVRSCVNPDHLEPVTARVNVNRGLRPRQQRLKTHCPHGHEYTDSNTYVDHKGWRRCRVCSSERDVVRRTKPVWRTMPEYAHANAPA